MAKRLTIHRRKPSSGPRINPEHKGLLHKDLGVPADQPIPAAKLEAATHSSDPKVKRRAVFAKTAKGWNH